MNTLLLVLKNKSILLYYLCNSSSLILLINQSVIEVGKLNYKKPNDGVFVLSELVEMTLSWINNVEYRRVIINGYNFTE